MRKRNKKGQFVKRTQEIGVVNLSTYTSPEVKEVSGKEWIEYGADNNYFQYLIDRYNGSPTNNAAINGISQAIYGKGINATDSSRKPNEYAQMVSLFKKDVVRKTCYDLKLMGNAAIQIIYSKDRSKIVQLEHIPVETLRPEKCDEDGDIPAYYYFKDWANIKRSDTPLRIPAFGTSKEAIEIYYIKPYRAGFYYISPVDYQGGLQYAELEEEVSNYHLNNILNGLAPSMLINFNNGVPNQQERQLLETKIAQKFSGTSNAGKFILSFNDNKETQSEITPVQLSDAHNQYQFLSEESTQKIMVAHRIVSPMLLGIKDGSGLGNNADEIKTASLLMDNTVIRPFQELLIDCFDSILAYNDITLNLYFTTLQPLEFTDVDKSVQDAETIEEETGVEMAKLSLKKIDGKQAYETKEEAIKVAEEMGCGGYHEHEIEGVVYYMPCETHQELKAPCWDGYEQYGTKIKNGKKVPNCVKMSIDRTELDTFLNESGEDEDLDNWALIDEREVDYEDEEALDFQIDQLNKKKKQSNLSKVWNFVSTGTARPNSKSKQDETFEGMKYKVRYQYSPLTTQADSREFCDKMVAAKKIYRKEDIIQMDSVKLNYGWAPKGKQQQGYSIWFYKGGGNCHHFWKRKTYMYKTDTRIDINSPLAPEISVAAARRNGFRPEKNNPLVGTKPKNMPDRGFINR